MILDLIPMAIGLFTDNKEVIQMAADNPVIALSGATTVLVELGTRLFPTKKHRSILTGVIAVCELVLSGLKLIDAKLSVMKKDK